jgi:hypothetical protein
VAVDLDEVREAQLLAEPRRAAERLGGEHRQVLDVVRPTSAEQRLQERIGQDTP